MEGLAVTDCKPFLISNGTFQHFPAPVSPSNDQGNCKIKKKVMILRKGARGLPNTMKIAQIRKNPALYEMVHLNKKMREFEVRSEVAKKFFKLDDVGYKFAAADKFGRLNFHEGEEWTASNIGKWAKKASVLYIVPEVELDDASDYSDDSSDESNSRPIQRPTADVKSEPMVQLVSQPSFLPIQPRDQKLCVLSKVNGGLGTVQLRDSAISGSSHDETMEVDSISPVTNQSSVVSISEEYPPPPLQDDFQGFDTNHFLDPFEVDGYYSMLYGNSDKVQGEASQPRSRDIPQKVPLGEQKPASPVGTSTSSGIEEDKSDSSASLEPAEPEQCTNPMNYISEMSPDRGPTKGGGKFIVLLEHDLPDGIEFPVRVKFGSIPDGIVDAFLKNHALTGSTIPASPVPGVVKVVVETQRGQYIGETEYTYEEEDKKAVLLEAVSTCDPKVLSELFFVLAGRMKSFAVNDDGSPADGNNFLQQLGGGHPEGNNQNQILDMLEVMVYLAAQVDGQQFVKIIFNTPLGKLLFKSYKDKSTQPQDIARENGHHEIAQYLDDIQQRFQQSDQDYPEEIEQVDWELVIQAVQKLADNQNQESELCTAQLCDEESDDDYRADDEASFSDSPDDEEQVLITVNKDPAYALALRKLNSTSHPNILCLFASGSVPSSIKVFAPRETLVAHLLSISRGSSMSHLYIVQDITRAIGYLQCKGVVHRDIRPDNVLITNSSCQLAITETVRALDCKKQKSPDNGDHNHMPDEQDVPEYIFLGVCGTSEWMAPECIKEGRFSTASDIYALGKLAFQLLTHNPAGDIPQAIRKSKMKEKKRGFCKEERMSSDIYSLLESCLKDNRRERPSPCDVLNTLNRIRSETIIHDDDCIPSLGPVGHPDVEPMLKPTNQIGLSTESFEELSKVQTSFETPTKSVSNYEDSPSHLTGRVPSLSTQRKTSQPSCTPGKIALLAIENDRSQHKDKGKPTVLPRINIPVEHSTKTISFGELESRGLDQEAHSSTEISGVNCKPLSHSDHTKEPNAGNDTSWKTAVALWMARVILCRTTDQPSTTFSKPGTTLDSLWTTGDNPRDKHNSAECKGNTSPPINAFMVWAQTKDQLRTTVSEPSAAEDSPWTTTYKTRTTSCSTGTTTETCKTTTDYKQCTATTKPKVTSKRSTVTADKNGASEQSCGNGVKIGEESCTEQGGDKFGSILGHLIDLILAVWIVALLSWFAAPWDSTALSSGKHEIHGATTRSYYERGCTPPSILNCFSDLRHFWSCCFPMKDATALKDMQKLAYSPFVSASTAVKLSGINRQIQMKQVNQTTRRKRQTKVSGHPGYGKSTVTHELRTWLYPIYGQEPWTTLGCSFLASFLRGARTKATSHENDNQSPEGVDLPLPVNSGSMLKKEETVHYNKCQGFETFPAVTVLNGDTPARWFEKLLSETNEICHSDANYKRIIETLQKHFQVRWNQSDTKLSACGVHHLQSLLTQLTQANKETNSAPDYEKEYVKQGFCSAHKRLSDPNQTRSIPSIAYIKGNEINQQSTLASQTIMRESMRDHEGQSGPRRPTDDTTSWTAERVLVRTSRGVCKQCGP